MARRHLTFKMLKCLMWTMSGKPPTEQDMHHHTSANTKHSEQLPNTNMIFNSLALPVGELWGAGTGWSIRLQVKERPWTVQHLLYPLCSVSAGTKRETSYSPGIELTTVYSNTSLQATSLQEYKARSLVYTRKGSKCSRVEKDRLLSCHLLRAIY